MQSVLPSSFLTCYDTFMTHTDLKGCPVTDKLQRALINYLQLTFPDMCAVAPVHTWPIGGKKFRRGGFRPQLAQVGHSVGDAATNNGGYMTDASQMFDREDLTFAKKNASHQKLSIFQVDPEELQVVRNSSLMYGRCIYRVKLRGR